MNATMDRMFGAPRMVRGVCATVAERAGVPVWVPRVALLLFAVVHWFLALLLYVVLARMLCPMARRVASGFAGQPPAPDIVGVRDRFSTLDARLAGLESATLQQETMLRRQFRDLERG